jgi:5'-methylthioadenosine phosphorylase
MMEPRIGIIGGSGLGSELLKDSGFTAADIDTPFGKPAAAPLIGQWQGIPVAILARHGAGHTFNPTQVPYRANIFALKTLGCRWILASGAVGSLQDHIHPRDVVLVDQAIDRTVHRPRTFFEHAAVHVDFAQPTCPRMRGLLLDAAADLPEPINVHPKGTYVCMEGPAFSTQAESRLHKSWGGDVIGMTLMPEAKLAREAEMAYASIALVTDYDSWRPHDPEIAPTDLMLEIISHLKQATASAMKLIAAAIPRVWDIRRETLPSHNAMALAIWSDKSNISNHEKQRLATLWGKYL